VQAVFNAFPSQTAARAVKDLHSGCVKIIGVIWADFNAFQAQLAVLGKVLDLFLWGARLRIMTPMAVKVAPFQEDAGADAWSIVDG
jgi:hypothetical protein